MLTWASLQAHVPSGRRDHDAPTLDGNAAQVECVAREVTRPIRWSITLVDTRLRVQCGNFLAHTGHSTTTVPEMLYCNIA